ncbi:hypothetical protein ACFSM5_04000 [Lacibacterium aquatile]|uniref:PAS domain-containing protein n=1 Tax=Lacibacterium aquatile TaxID=1168082 RepID=A0ABW5DND8_9PROT
MRVPEDLNRHFAELYGLWSARSEEGRLPARRSLGLPDLPLILRGSTNLLAVEVQPDGSLDFRFRLFGSLQRMATLAPPTGRLIGEVIPEAGYLDMMRRHYQEVVESRAPRLDQISNSIGEEGQQEAYAYDRLILPLSSDGETVTDLMTCAAKANRT